jgi:hypothetical protein
MKEPKQGGSSKFSCKGVTVYFVYSFSVHTNGSYVVEPELMRKHPGWKINTPSSRLGILPHIVFKPRSAWHDGEQLDGTVRQDDKSYRVKVNVFTRLFTLGGTCCLTIQIPRNDGNDLDTNAVLGLLGLVGLRKKEAETPGHSKLLLDRQNEPLKSVYPLFRESVRKRCKETGINWCEDGQFDFIDVKDEVQTPWVVTVLEVDSKIAEAFCSTGGKEDSQELDEDRVKEKLRRIREFESEIAPILFRSVSKGFQVEPCYLSSPTPGSSPGLFSINVDARLFVSISRRSMLCICRNKEEDPAQYFLPSLLDICELIRVRWHMLIVMNKVLDDFLSRLSGSVGHKAETEHHHEEMMKLRAWLAMNLEDPGIYIVAGDALSQIYDDQRKTFRLDELRTMLLGKMDLLDRMYRDVMELSWAQHSPERRRKNK